MRSHQPDADIPGLTVIEGDASRGMHGLVPLPPSAGGWAERPASATLPHRPGDHLELWSFAATDTLRELRRAARERGLSADTAISLLCERRLACEDLLTLGLDQTIGAIEQVAVDAEAPLSMWAPTRRYLRALLHGEALERASRVPLSAPQAAVPIRLLDRLRERELLAEAPQPGELDSAINWEAAALCGGRLLGEWALTTALAMGTPGGAFAVRS